MAKPGVDIRDAAVRFPADIYADVRLERVARTEVVYRDGELRSVAPRVVSGALLRVLKAGRWYYAVTTDLDTISDQLEQLASSACLTPGPHAGMHALLQPHQVCVRRFDDDRVENIPLADRIGLLTSRFPLLDRPSIRTWRSTWLDVHRDRRFLSSKGADVIHDYQEAGFIYQFSMVDGNETFMERFTRGANTFAELQANSARHTAEMEQRIVACERFVRDATPVEPGTYPVVLSPVVAGVFAHESFGHKSEADFMLGDAAMLEAWKIGTRVGSEILSIVDDGAMVGSGYAPYDDEGQPSQKTYLIKNGVLTGRLHSAPTAAALDESCTGNARALSFRYEPIVRMTTTYIEAGDATREDLFAGVDDGFFIETFKHGSGMSTFTIAPSLAWRIRGGRIAEPVRIAVLTGTVFETLGEIDALSDTVEIPNIVGGGCGKFEQWPLPVGFGGPYVRIKRMNVA